MNGGHLASRITASPTPASLRRPVAVGLFALNFPVFLDAYDQWGFQIKCGTGYVSDLTQAAASAGEHNYVDECETALLVRRLWTIPLVVVGGPVVLVALVASATASARESLDGTPRYAPDIASPGVSTPDGPALQRRLGTFDAVTIGLGSMIGAGIFVALGPAAAAGGLRSAHRARRRRRRRVLQRNVVCPAGRAVSAVRRHLRLRPGAPRRVLGLHRGVELRRRQDRVLRGDGAHRRLTTCGRPGRTRSRWPRWSR